MRIFIFATLISFATISCNESTGPIDLGNEAKVREALAHKWESEYREMIGSRSKIPESQVAHIQYNSDGTYSAGIKNGVLKSKGKWSYEPKEQLIKRHTENGEYSSRILKLTSSELVLAEYTLMNDEVVDSLLTSFRKL
jgi:hypothetical protein